MNRTRSVLTLLCGALLLCALVAASAPPAAEAGSVDRALTKLRKQKDISKSRARWANRQYSKAVKTRTKLRRGVKRLRGKQRAKRRAQAKARVRALNWQIRNVESMARRGRISRTRVTPLFTTLSVNAAWFRSNGTRPAGTDRRFKGSRIIYQYFPGSGWQFHPLSNFSKLNAIWTVDTPPSRRAQRAYAKELIRWGVKRGKGLVWEYYFNYQGSPAPWISAISQGAAIQSLARVGERFNNKGFKRAAVRGSYAFDTPAPNGLRVRRDGGFHYLGYSGNKRLIILNMFLSSLDGLRSFALITDNRRGRYLYQRGLDAARTVTPKFDTGSWSLYSLDGKKSDAHYHQLTISFLDKICDYTGEDVFCKTRDRFKSYAK